MRNTTVAPAVSALLVVLVAVLVAVPPAIPPAAAAATPAGTVVMLEDAAAVDAAVEALVADGVAQEDITVITALDAVVVQNGPSTTEVVDALDLVARDVVTVESDPIATIATTPNDPLYETYQWGHVVTAVDDAWGRTTGSSDVVVAIVDTGVSAVSELTGAVLPGYDFVNNDAVANDDNGHGTQAATVTAARTDNGIGMAGVCWTCKILPVKVLGANGSGTYSAIASGIVWAVDRGADVVNLSLGGTSPSSLLDAAVSYATSNGVLVLAAAGNNGADQAFYPAASPGAVSVAGSTQEDARYSWSNYGTGRVDIAAPGCNVAQRTDGAYAWFCGTSSATPFVAGIAALARTVNPVMSGPDLAAALRSATVSNGFTRHGRIDAAKLLFESGAVDVVAPAVSFVTPLPNQVLSGTFVSSATGADAGGVTRAELYVGNTLHAQLSTAPWSTSIDAAAHPSGTTVLRWRLFDRAGNVGVVQRTVVLDNAPPSVTFTSPLPLQPVRGVVSVAASISDDVGIASASLFLNNASIASFVTAPYQTSVNTASLPEGPVTLRWRATDRAGKTTVVERTMVVDRSNPTASVTWPNPGRHVRGVVGVRTQIGDVNGITSTSLLVDGVVVDTRPGAPTVLSFDTSGRSGRLEFALRVIDRAGNVTISPGRVVFVDTTAPQVAFAAPAPNQRISSPVQVAANVTDAGGIAQVQLFANGQIVGTDTQAPWSVTFDSAGRAAGPVVLRWVAIDLAGNRAVVSRTVVIP